MARCNTMNCDLNVFIFQMSSHSIAETVQLKCRYCQTKILRKNYKAHLKSAHPDKDSSDLTPASQPKLITFLKSKTPPVTLTEHDAVWKRGRHESGESIDSGFAPPESVIDDEDFDMNRTEVTDSFDDLGNDEVKDYSNTEGERGDEVDIDKEEL